MSGAELLEAREECWSAKVVAGRSLWKDERSNTCNYIICS